MKIRRPVPGSDWTFSSSDYEAGELITHAQSCLWIVGESELANALVGGFKVHNALAATMLNMAYDDFQHAVKEAVTAAICAAARQAAKPGNFGFPGLMGAVTMVLQQRKQGPDTPCPNGPSMIVDDNGNLVPGYKGLRFCILMDGAEECGRPEDKVVVWGEREIPPTCVPCIRAAQRLREYWIRQWPENEEYFAFVKGCMRDGMTITAEALARWPHLREYYRAGQQLDPAQIMHHWSGRLRGGIQSPSSCANGFFQGLLSEITKWAHRIITRECYDPTARVPDMLFENSKPSRFAGAQSPLYGSRIPVSQHDELIGEHPSSVAPEAATRVGEVMVAVMRHVCPDIAPAAAVEPCLMKAWYKSAKSVYDANGRLTVWEPKRVAA